MKMMVLTPFKFPSLNSAAYYISIDNAGLRPNKKNKLCLLFRTTRPYLNLMVKPRIISGFSGKKKFDAFFKTNA